MAQFLSYWAYSLCKRWCILLLLFSTAKVTVTGVFNAPVLLLTLVRDPSLRMEDGETVIDHSI